MTEILILTNTKMINIIIPILSLQSWKKNFFLKNVYQKKKKKKKLKTNKKYKIFEQKFESLNLCMVMLMAHIIIYQLIMSFNTQIFLMIKNENTNLNIYFLKDTAVINGFIVKMMKNQIMKMNLLIYYSFNQ